MPAGGALLEGGVLLTGGFTPAGSLSFASRALAFTATHPSIAIPAPAAAPFAVFVPSAIMPPSRPPTIEAVMHSCDLASELCIPLITSAGVGAAAVCVEAQPLSVLRATTPVSAIKKRREKGGLFILSLIGYSGSTLEHNAWLLDLLTQNIL